MRDDHEIDVGLIEKYTDKLHNCSIVLYGVEVVPNKLDYKLDSLNFECTCLVNMYLDNDPVVIVDLSEMDMPILEILASDFSPIVACGSSSVMIKESSLGEFLSILKQTNTNCSYKTFKLNKFRHVEYQEAIL